MFHVKHFDTNKNNYYQKEKNIMEKYNTELLISTCRQYNVTLTDFQLQQFITYYEMLIEKNKVMNLTAITEYEDVVYKHFVDSISIVKYFDFKNCQKMIDVGTGAGFPGIPLKIVMPEIEICLMDSLNKRINFLNEVITQLKLEKITAVHSRAEDLGRNNNFREKFDVCVSRAVANLSTLSEYCTPFLKKDGYFISYKSGNIEEEIINCQNAFKELHCTPETIEKFNIEGTDYNRSLVIIKKTGKTGNQYPRKSGIPAKKPL